MKKTLKIILVIALVIIILAVLMFLFIFSPADKYVCTSDEGNITILYKKDKIVGVTNKGYSFDLEEQQEHAKKVGIETYLNEFNAWFISNSTNGKCEKK